MARYRDVIGGRLNYVSIIAWGVVAIVLTLAFLPIGVIYALVVRAHRLFASIKHSHDVPVQGQPAQ